MTEDQMKAYFKWHEDKPLQVVNGYGCALVESLYQAFKARMEAEGLLVHGVSLDCYGIEGNKGKSEVER